jgi:hypothetical protein
MLVAGREGGALSLYFDFFRIVVERGTLSPGELAVDNEDSSLAGDGSLGWIDCVSPFEPDPFAFESLSGFVPAPSGFLSASGADRTIPETLLRCWSTSGRDLTSRLTLRGLLGANWDRRRPLGVPLESALLIRAI